MAMKYLGESFDIHTSGRELVFPHHENEIAISAALTGKPLAKYWIHCDRVMKDGKIADESGLELTIDNLSKKGYTGREIRYWLLSGHYRKPIPFSEKRLEDARRNLKRLDTFVHTLQTVDRGEPFPELDQLLYDIKNGFTGAMDDDLNISAAMAAVFKNIRRVNVLILEKRIDAQGAAKILDAFRQIDSVLKIFEFDMAPYDAEIRRLTEEREAARAAKDWDRADRIRETLAAKGVLVRDKKVL
jgi:cysteinyl-tRNA synthetase